MNSTTHTHDLNWFLKWAATVILIIGSAVNSMGFYPAGPLIINLGGTLWLIVAIRWREKSLIFTNGAVTLVSMLGLAWHYYAEIYSLLTL
jgi:hypothetical protein